LLAREWIVYHDRTAIWISPVLKKHALVIQPPAPIPIFLTLRIIGFDYLINSPTDF
jgi:hypothetical protein